MSYAWWTYINIQGSTNIIETDCFKIKFIDENPIHLEKAYPLLDKEGLELSPYTFTIENVCNGSAIYQINLETMKQSGVKVLPDNYIKLNLKEGTYNKITTKLNKEINPNLNTEKMNAETIEAYKLVTGILEPKEQKTFYLRLWIDEDVTIENEDSMNASYQGKISIVSNYYNDNRGTLMAQSNTKAFWKYRESITKVVFEDEMNPKQTNEELVFDVSSKQDKSVMSYLILNEKEQETDIDTYTLYIQSDGGIKANSNSSSLFYNFKKLETIEGIKYLDTSKVITMNSMFEGCSSLIGLDLSSFDTSNVIDMHHMFYFCRAMTTLDISNFNTDNVENMSFMFANCNLLTSINVNNFNTSKVTTMASMFQYCSNIKNLNLSSFDTSKVRNMSSMFYNNPSLKNLDLSSFDTNNVINMNNMFTYLNNITIVYGISFVHKTEATVVGMFKFSNANKPTDFSWNDVIFD